MGPRVLLTLPQIPHDPASGGARTMSTIAEFLAESGFTVRALATTMSESRGAFDLAGAMDAAESVRRRGDPSLGAPVIGYRRRGVDHLVQDVGGCPPTEWRRRHGRHYDQLFEDELARFRPDVLLTFGAEPHDVERRRQVRAAGGRVVFGLFHTGYLDSGLGPHIDAVLTPSTFVTERYRERWGIESTPLPTPVQLDEVLCPTRVPTRVTMVNPSVGKGAMLVARLAETLGTGSPGIPLEVFESRASGQFLVQAGFVGGFDLRRHRTLHLRPMVPMPRLIYQHTRVLLVPSVAEEASARVVAEALLNGIPVVASDVGGLAENCAGGGCVLPLPPGLTVTTRRPVSADAVQPWVDVLRTLFFDPAAYEEAGARAGRAGQRYRPNLVRAQYAAYFRRVLDAPSHPGGGPGPGPLVVSRVVRGARIPLSGSQW